MRVAIITFHCSYNFGSALQALALQKAVESLGHEATIIDYRSADFRYYKLFRLSRPRQMIDMIKNFPQNWKRKKAYEDFWKSFFHLTDETFSYRSEQRLKSIGGKFDCYLCGSDQIWNLNCTQGIVEPFFLSFVEEGKRKASYAPSLAHTEFKSEFFDRERLKALLDAFDFISVREKSTLPLLADVVEGPVYVVPDPTLLLSREDYEEIAMPYDTVGEAYVFLYELRSCPELLESAYKVASKMNLKLLYHADEDIEYDNAKNVRGIGPAEFIGLIANAKAVLTNSFHATVFSTVFKRPFLAFACDESASRVKDFLSLVGLDACCFSGATASVPIVADWDKVEERELGIRERSLEILRYAIEG